MELETKLVKQGSGYYLRIPTALINTKVLIPEKTYIIDPKEKK